jgi:hypothetical protein
VRIDEPIPVLGPSLGGRVRSVPWVTTGFGMLTAGLLAGASALLRWWGACLPSSTGSVSCDARRADDLGLRDFTTLTGDLRVAAILLALGGLAAGLMWFIPLFFEAAQRWRTTAVTSLVVLASAKWIADLSWYLGGDHPSFDIAVVSDLSWLALAMLTYTPALQFTAAESIASRRRGGARLTFLMVGIVAAGPLGVFVDSLTWRAAYNSPGYAPGEGLLHAGTLTLLGIAVLAASLRRSTPTQPPTDKPEFTLAA